MPAHKAEIDRDQLKALAAIFCTLREAAAVLGVGIATLMRRFEEDSSLKQAWEDGREQGKTSLRRKQFILADKNAGMAIFLGKNYLGQTDVHVQESRPAPVVPPMDLSTATPEELAVLEAIARRNEEAQAEAARIAAEEAEAARAEREAEGATQH
jgi:hypothetical protein